LQALDLDVQVVPLSVPAYAPIQDEQPSIGFADQAFDFRAGDTRFVSHSDRRDFPGFDPFAHGQWM
jgi:hypothetical protein